MVLADLSGLFAGIGMLMCFLGLTVVRHFARPTASGKSTVLPPLSPVTILKPLCGEEPLLEQALESCFAQAYPEFQIVFGVHGAADPALAVVERVRRRFPDRDISVVIDATMHGTNRKLSNLINMLPFAKHEILVISDSDLHVPPNYLERLVSTLEKPGVGLVTALFCGMPPVCEGWALALAAAHINHTFVPGVLLSRLMGRQDCLGPTAMFRRETLERTGGFHPLVHVLAEDNVLGQRIRNLGLSIELVDVVPAAIVPEATLRAVWQHELRWVRTLRELAPLLSCASSLQFPLFWAALAVILSGGVAWSIALFFGCWAARAISAGGIDGTLRDRFGLRGFAMPLWLLPVRDVLSVAEIGACFLVNEVTWRGHKLAAGGVAIVPIHSAMDGQD